MEVCGYLRYHIPGQQIVNFGYCGRLPENLARLWDYPEFESEITKYLQGEACRKDLRVLKHLTIVDCLNNNSSRIAIVTEECHATPGNLMNTTTIVSSLPKYGLVTISKAVGNTALLISRVRSLVGVVHSNTGYLHFEKSFPPQIWEADGEHPGSFQSAVFTHGMSSSDHLIVSVIGTY